MFDTVRSRLTDCVEDDESCKHRLSITLPKREALDDVATTLAKLLAGAAK